MTGSTESCCDDVIINGVPYAGDLSAVVVTSTDNVITMSMDSDGSVAEDYGYGIGWTVSAECASEPTFCDTVHPIP
jgi:hypothetical protein